MSGVSTEDGRRRDQETRDQRTGAATTAVVGNAQVADNYQKGGCEMKTVKKAGHLDRQAPRGDGERFTSKREAVYPH